MPQEETETYEITIEIPLDEMVASRERYKRRMNRKLERKIRRARKRFQHFRHRHVLVFKEYGLDYMRGIKGLASE